jgi:hypothetical protein
LVSAQYCHTKLVAKAHTKLIFSFFFLHCNDDIETS